MEHFLKQLRDQKPFSDADVRTAFDLLLEAETHDEQIREFLELLSLLPVDAVWLTQAALSLREKCLKVQLGGLKALDTAGTGGDGSGSFNFSTAAALLAAACGVPVAKHGNRSISSQSGSADLLEALGVPIDLGPDEVARSVAQKGFGFMMAPKYHPATARVQKIRRQLGKTTVFNYLGPLVNPAGVPCQVVGVNRDELRPVMAEALRRLGSERAWVVWGEGGLDECSVVGATHVSELKAGQVREWCFNPEDVVLRRTELKYLKGGDGVHNAKILRGIFENNFFGPLVQGILLNAAAALVVGDAARDLKEGLSRAKLALNEGRALDLLEQLQGD